MTRSKIIIAVLAAGAIFAAILYWRGANTVSNQYQELCKHLAPLFAKYDLENDHLIKERLEEKKSGSVRYMRSYKEFDVPRNFVWKSFELALRTRLDKTAFRITKLDQLFTKTSETHTVAVSFKNYEIFELKVVKKKAGAAPADIPKVFKNPKVAIVIDDFGYTMGNLGAFFAIEKPITLSILPELAHSREVAKAAHSRGHEIILHLPLAAHRKDIGEEKDTIRSGMSKKDIVSRLDREIATVPFLTGVSNHQGSEATEDKELMAVILGYLKARGLYFFDSLTSLKSVCQEAAVSIDIKFAKRDMFLDNSNDPAYIETQLRDLEKLAFSRGSVIAICHDRKNTVAALNKMMPKMAEDGVVFVYLSEMVK